MKRIEGDQVRTCDVCGWQGTAHHCAACDLTLCVGCIGDQPSAHPCRWLQWENRRACEELRAELEVERGVRIPRHTTGPKPKYAFPWDDLEQGDSFLIPDGTGPAASTKTHAYRGAEARGFRVTVRRVEGGYRVWRVS